MNSIFSAGPRLHAPCEAGAPRGRLERLPGLRAHALSVPLMTTALTADAADLTLFNTYQEITGTSVDTDKLTIVGGQLAVVNNFGLTRAMHRVLGETLLDSGSINLAAGGSATLSFEQGVGLGGLISNEPFYFDVYPHFGQSFIVRNKLGAAQIYQGELGLRNQVEFFNEGTYSIHNNKGIVSEGTNTAQFINTGSLVKFAPVGDLVPGAANVSNIGVPLTQISGNTTAFVGTLALDGGGTSTNSMFVTQGLETGKISFGGNNVFRGAVGTRGACGVVFYLAGCPFAQSDGAFELQAGGKIAVENGAVWEHIGTFDNKGTVIIAPGGTLKSHGRFEQSAAGVVKGGGTLHNAGIGDPDAGDSYFDGTGGYFSGNNAVIPADGSNPELRLSVLNGGTFEIKAGQTVEVGSFDNYGGLLRVNGTLNNVGGRLRLLGGEIQGLGVVNGGGVSVGGGPGVAVFNPGNSPGTLTVNGDFELLPGGILNLEIVRDGNGQIAFDRVLAQSYVLDAHQRCKRCAHRGTHRDCGPRATGLCTAAGRTRSGRCGCESPQGSKMPWSPGRLNCHDGLTSGPLQRLVTVRTSA